MSPRFRRIAAGTGLLAAALLSGASVPLSVREVPGAIGAGAEWTGINADSDETGYSRLAQITPANAARLGLAWTYELPGEVSLEAAPLAVGGKLYFTGSYATVYAVDAASGKLAWSFAPETWKHNPAKMHYGFGANRGVAYAGGKIFSAALDGRLIALDAASGAVLWQVETTDPKGGQTITGTPRVFAGKVIVGQGGADFGMRGYVTAYDQASGKQLWRFYVVPGSPEANAGDPAMLGAAESWSGDFWKHTGGGGGPWDSITYDAALNRIYVGTANASPYDADARSPGTGDNLYTAAVVALDADTGKYIWHHQNNPRDSWDFDATQQMTLATLTIAGQPRRVLMQAPKNGFFYVLDRETGKVINAGAVGKQNWADHIDLATGRPVENKNIRYETGREPHIPFGRGGAQLAAHGLQPGDRAGLRANDGAWHALSPGQAGRRRCQCRRAQYRQPGDRKRRWHSHAGRLGSGGGQAALAGAAAHDVQRRGGGDRGRRGVPGRRRWLAGGLRCEQRRAAVARLCRDGDHRRAQHLCDRRQAVSRGTGWLRRHRLDLRSGDEPGLEIRGAAAAAGICAGRQGAPARLARADACDQSAGPSRSARSGQDRDRQGDVSRLRRVPRAAVGFGRRARAGLARIGCAARCRCVPLGGPRWRADEPGDAGLSVHRQADRRPAPVHPRGCTGGAGASQGCTPMKMTGEERIAASRQQVWDALNDPDVLRRCIPGCESLERDADEALRAVVQIKIGPIGARFTGKVTLSDVDAPNGYTIAGEGQGGTVGSAKGGAKVRLSDAGGGVTLLGYTVDAQVGGRLAQLGGPIIDATARQLAGRFFATLGGIVGQAAAPVAADDGHASDAARIVSTATLDRGALPVPATPAGVSVGWLLGPGIAAMVGFLIGRAQPGAGSSDWMALAIGLLVVIVAAAGFAFGRQSAAPVITLDAALLARLLGERPK